MNTNRSKEETQPKESALPPELAEIKKIVGKEVNTAAIRLLKHMEPDYDARPPLRESGLEPDHKDTWASNAWSLARLSKLAYKSPFLFNWEIRRSYKDQTGLVKQRIESPATNTQVYAVSDKNQIIIAFRGTQTDNLKDEVADFRTDTKASLRKWHAGEVHTGFGWALESVWDEIDSFIKENDEFEKKKIWFTGHSLGGALAMLAMSMFLKTEAPVQRAKHVHLYTFGQPRVGNREFAKRMAEEFSKRIYRVVNNNDLVTFIPFGNGYRHVGQRIYIKTNGDVYLVKPGWKRQWGDMALGLLAFLSINFFKILANRFLKMSFKLDSIFGDHDIKKYIGSISAKCMYDAAEQPGTGKIVARRFDLDE